MKPFHVSIAKPGQGTINEDATVHRSDLIAVSDGAGGGGVYAEKWSRYLLSHLPDAPICTAKELDDWIASIWEPFYNQCEEDAKKEGGLFLEKFYDEGSFATLVAAWCETDGIWKWMSYGDSVVFHYNRGTDTLGHSFTSLVDFDKPPYLINCKDELNPKGFRSGIFATDKDSIVFCASDALAHYILMMYEVTHSDKFNDELTSVRISGSKNQMYLQNAMLLKDIDFEKDVLGKLLHCRSNNAFQLHMEKLYRKKLIALDDYSFAMVGYSTKAN